MTEPLMIRMGIYRHHRGPLYQVLGLCHDANSLRDHIRVLYVPLQLDGAHLGPRMAVRDLNDFVGWVDDPKAPEMMFADGSKRRVWRRFTYLGPMLTAEMLEKQP